MKLKETVEELISQHASLFGKNRYRVLDFLFFSGTEQYEWQKGELVRLDENRKDLKSLYLEKAAARSVGMKWEDWQKQKKEEEEIRIKKLTESDVEFGPLNLLANIFDIPTNVQEDWLHGAYEIIDYAMTQPDKHGNHEKLKELRTKLVETFGMA